MKRFSAPPSVYADPTRPPDDDDSDASSLSDGSKKVKTAQSFESLFNSESLSDVVLDINEGEYIFHAHKMIVGLKSERLAALITNAISLPTDNSCDGGKPVLYLQEPAECSAVFSRFLYFIYSGAVWLHRDYVVPLFQLAVKYGVSALAAHCENYIVQILNKMLHIAPSSPLTQSLRIISVCDLYEDPAYRDETKKVAFEVLCKRFPDFVRTDRWISASWTTVRDLLHSDYCTSEENLILVSATDWMKRNKLQDKARIQEILSSIRYPRLPRRVLYHLHATSSFKKFPPVQNLIEAAIRYHCFKDVPEAQAEFGGLQYKTRGCNDDNSNNNNENSSYNNNNIRNMGHSSMCGVENGDSNNTTNNNSPTSPIEFEQYNDNNNNNNNNDDYNNALQQAASSSSPEENHISFPVDFNTTTTTTTTPSLNPPPSSSSSLSLLLSPPPRNGTGEMNGCCHHQNQQGPGLLNDISSSLLLSSSSSPSTTTGSNSNPNPHSTAPTLPIRHHRSRSEDRHGSPTPMKEHRVNSGSRHHHHHHHPHHRHNHHHHHHHHTTTSRESTTAPSITNNPAITNRRHFSVFDQPAISSFQSPCSPVATIQPLVVHGAGVARRLTDDDCIQDDDDDDDDDDDGLDFGQETSLLLASSGSSSNNIIISNNTNSNNSANNDFDNNNVICHSHIRKL